jgi:CRISPR type IV-associated protein Csf3
VPLLRVRAELATPVALMEPLHLDGVLMAQRLGADRERLTRSCEAEHIATAPIPVVHLDHAGARAYLTSAAEPAPEARRLGEHLTRKRDADDWDYLSRPVNIASGALRDVCLRFPVIATPWLEWWAIGDRQGVRKVIKGVHAVGMLRRHGYGEVLGWDVIVESAVDADVDAAVAAVLVGSGRARRNLPAAWCEAPEVLERVPIAPPYWHPATWTEGVKVGRGTGLAQSVRERLVRLR